MTESRMVERSLSALYRADVRRDAAGADAADLQALGAGGAIDPAVLERLARTPDALAVQGLARALSPWSVTVAEDMRRARTGGVGGISRVRPWGWVSLAAAAGLAVCVVGLRQDEASDVPSQVAIQRGAGISQGAAADDILFADPDNAMLAARSAPSSDSIFTDSLDASTSPRES